MPGEEVLYTAVQQKPVMNVSPDAVVLTSKRCIVYRPKMFGRVDFADFVWRNLVDAKVKESMLGATFTAQTTNGQIHSVDYLPKAQARKLYTIAQSMEEKSLEERRQRELEDKRAASGGLVVNTGVVTPPATPPQDDCFQKLKKLKDMLDAGLISADEFNAKKTDILSRM